MTDVLPSNREIIQRANWPILYWAITSIRFCSAVPLTHFKKKAFEICCCTLASADEIMLLIFWKCICSGIWKFLCCSLMAFLFWSLTLFGDSEWMQRKIHSFIFSKNIDNFFLYLCSSLLLVFLLVPFLPVDFGVRFKVDPRLDASHVDGLIQLIHLRNLT